MALDVNYTYSIYNSDGDKMVFVDTTPPYSANETGGYGSPNITRAQVSMVRIQFGNFPDITAQTTKKAGETLVQYRKYLKTSGSAQTYDNKVIESGDVYIPFLTSTTVIAGDIFQDLGYYVPFVPVASFLPTTNTTPYILSIPQVGLAATNQTITDLVWSLQYEVYGVATSTPFTTVQGQQYIVSGDGLVEQSGSTYRYGEVFIGDGTLLIFVDDVPSISPLRSITEKTFVTDYNLRLAIYNLQSERLANPCACQSDSDIQIAKLYNLLDFLSYQQYTNAVSFQQATDLLEFGMVQVSQIRNLPC
jgi:hypothetical protein